MRPPKQKQPQVKKGLCRVLERVLRCRCRCRHSLFLEEITVQACLLFLGDRINVCARLRKQMVLQVRNQRLLTLSQKGGSR